MNRETYIDQLKKLLNGLTYGKPPNLEARLKDLVRDMPVPIFWLLGKAQAGKSSIIQAITGLPREQIKIGEGFRACTKTSSLYPFPAEPAPILQFLDTRGLFEAGYDATEDIRVHEDQAHVLLVVVKANDHALGQLVTTLQAITSRHPEWPVIVIQTCLHECYPTAFQHPQPYPFDQVPFPDSVPRELKENLVRQRETFSKFNATFVPVDFTQPGDGFEPLNYGHEKLFAALEKVLPEVTWNILHELDQGRIAGTFWRAAHPHLISYSLLAASVAAVPVPLIDLPLISAVQVKMLHSIAGVYRQELSYRRMHEIASVVGLGFLMRLGSRELLKVLPGGNILNSISMAASTYGLGCVFCAYFKYVHEGTTPDREELRRILYEQMAVAEHLFKRWEKKDDED